MVRQLLTQLRRRPTQQRPEPTGPAIQRREHELAKARLLRLAQQRRAAHLYDGPAR